MQGEDTILHRENIKPPTLRVYDCANRLLNIKYQRLNGIRFAHYTLTECAKDIFILCI